MNSRKQILGSDSGKKIDLKMEPDKVSNAYLIKLLSDIAPVTDDMLNLLNLPDKIPQASDWTFSTNRILSSGVLYKLRNGTKINELPDFSISIDNSGSGVYLTLLDGRRRIIVSSQVDHAMTNSASFSQFTTFLKATIELANKNPGSIAISIDNMPPFLE